MIHIRIILASASPRRRQLLTQIGLDYEAVEADTPEDNDPSAGPRVLVRQNAVKKASNVAGRVNGPAVIIGADTVVSLDGAILGKPADEAGAAGMLRRISGRRHAVYTGVCLLLKQVVSAAGESDAEHGRTRKISFVSTAGVYMRELTEGEISAYVATGEPMDKAGAYAVQGRGSVFVKKINGDYYTVMGLPVARLYAELRRLGIWSEPCRGLPDEEAVNVISKL